MISSQLATRVDNKIDKAVMYQDISEIKGHNLLKKSYCLGGLSGNQDDVVMGGALNDGQDTLSPRL